MEVTIDDKSDGFKSPSADRRKALYKCGTPPWKDVYRKRCRDRFISNRETILQRFRHRSDAGLEAEAVGGEGELPADLTELMLNEWKSFQQEMKTAWDGSPETSWMSDIDQVDSVFEQIATELLREEQQIIAEEYEARHLIDDNAMHSYIESHAMDERDNVICPLCAKSPLFLNHTIVCCPCGLRIYTEQETLTLDMIRQNLTEYTNQHALSCCHRPTFCVVNQLGVVNNLLMTCSVCDTMIIII